MPASTKSQQNVVRGPAKRPEWAQMIRFGGDRTAVLFGELRKSVGKVDGIVEQLRYSGRESRWVVHYEVEATELFSARISPGLLEAEIPLDRTDLESFLRMCTPGGWIKDAIDGSSNGAATERVKFKLKNRRMVRSFANLVMAKARLAQKLRK